MRMNRKRVLRRVLTVALGIFVTVLMGSASDAATTYYLPGSMGQGINGGAGCFYEDHGSEQNTCGSAQYWNFPLVTDSSQLGTYINSTIEVYGATPSNTVGCYGYSVDHSSTELYSVYQGTQVYPSTFGSVTTLSPGSFYNGYGWVQMVCVVSPSGYVNNIVYN